uniref:Uncharacterized protein n=1 Tax=Physcomitrium patens TaxID=3218 RepID=A0A2K1K8H0_PHYPA|nr:hypothetical protein PHYPA_011972 [Physcomitrium patens]
MVSKVVDWSLQDNNLQLKAPLSLATSISEFFFHYVFIDCLSSYHTNVQSTLFHQ